LELADPAAAVEKIFPPGYVDPMLAAQEGGGQPPPGPPPSLIPEGPNMFGPGGQPPGGEENPYGAPGFSPEYRSSQGQLGEATLTERQQELVETWERELGEIVDEMLASASQNGSS
jgi:hypothetical protein